MPHAKTVILGAGLSGLAIASAHFPSAVVLEASSRVGGWAHSIRRHDGHLFECGPHSLRLRGCANSLALTDLLAKLKIQPIVAAPEAKRRLIWHHGAIVALPDLSSPWNIMRNPLTRSVPWFVVRDILGLSPPRPMRDETVHEFASRKFSPLVADSLVTAFIAGVYAGDAKKLSSEIVFKDAVQREYRIGSAFRPGVSGFFKSLLGGSKKVSTVSFAQGVSEFSNALRASLKPSCEVRLNEPVTQMRRVHDGTKWLITTSSGTEYEADRVISTLPLGTVHSVLPRKFSPMLDQCVAHLGSVNVAVVNLKYPSQLPPQAFGHLVASVEEQSKTGVLGVIYDSVVFPVQQMGDRGSVVSVMLGGAHAPWVSNESTEAIIARAEQAMRDHLGFQERPVDVHVSVHFNCIPQFTPGHAQRVVFARQELAEANLTLLGTGVLGAGMVDAIGGALRACEVLKVSQA